MKIMSHEEDAYGQEILAAYEGRPSYEVVERDDGFIDLSGGAAHYFQEYKSWPRWQNKALSSRGGGFWMLDRERVELRSIYKGGAIK